MLNKPHKVHLLRACSCFMSSEDPAPTRQLPIDGSDEYKKELKEASAKLLNLVAEMKRAPEVYAWAKEMLDEIPQFIECGELQLEGVNTLLNFLSEEFQKFKAQGTHGYQLCNHR